MPASLRISRVKACYESQEIADLYQLFDTYVPEEVFENYQRTLVQQNNVRVQIILPERFLELALAVLTSLSEALEGGNFEIVQGEAE